ncbi:MAG: ATP-dependent Clp protease adaptor ClpS [Pirellulaceae bacterium]
MPVKTAEVEMHPEIKPVTRRRRKMDKETRTKRQPPYAVILHNDDFNTMPFVVSVLRKVFGYGRVKSMRLMLHAHLRGRVVIWSGMREVAELKADQVKSCGPDPDAPGPALPLRVSVEPQP